LYELIEIFRISYFRICTLFSLVSFNAQLIGFGISKEGYKKSDSMVGDL